MPFRALPEIRLPRGGTPKTGATFPLVPVGLFAWPVAVSTKSVPPISLPSDRLVIAMPLPPLAQPVECTGAGRGAIGPFPPGALDVDGGILHLSGFCDPIAGRLHGPRAALVSRGSGADPAACEFRLPRLNLQPWKGFGECDRLLSRLRPGRRSDLWRVGGSLSRPRLCGHGDQPEYSLDRGADGLWESTQRAEPVLRRSLGIPCAEAELRDGVEVGFA